MTARDAGYRATVLLVDDEEAIRESLGMVLEHEGYRVEEAAGGAEALVQASNRVVDAVLLDIKLNDMDGLDVLRQFRERGLTMPVIMITGHGDVSTALDAIRGGAYDFFEKPLQRERVLLSLRNALDTYRLQMENRSLRHSPDELIGSSDVVRSLRETIEKAAPTPATVLITGESGTGKELVARGIHGLSTRREMPLIQVNCAAIPEELIESELFGHERGSFTGAQKKQIGKFVAADGGTIFLDEIGDMSGRTQAKVLRVLQNGEVEPVGAARTVQVDVRVVAATNRNLEEEIAEGRFREDLLYRLNVIPVRTPSLREHPDDVPDLVEYFVRRYSEINNYRRKPFSAEAMTALQAMPWKGNVRELKNFVERLLILGSDEEVQASDVKSLAGLSSREGGDAFLDAPTLRLFREAAEASFLRRKLEQNGWNVTKTARTIDTPRSNLYKKMEQYEITRPGSDDDG